MLLTALIGAAVGLGKTLMREDFSAAYIIGNVLAHTTLAMAAGSLLIWLPDLPFLALTGTSAGIASMGVVAFQLIVRHRLGLEKEQHEKSTSQRSRPRHYDQDWWE